MSGFSITITPQSARRAARLLANEPIRVYPHARIQPEWAGETVEITGLAEGAEGVAFRAWVLNADGMPTYRTEIRLDDLAFVTLPEEES